MSKTLSVKSHYLTSTCVAIAALCAPVLHARETAQLELRTGAVYTTNPTLIEGEDTDGAAIDFEARPRLTWQDETSSISLNGVLRYETFFEDYGSSFSGSANLGVQKAVSETLQLSAGAQYRNTSRVTSDLLYGPISGDGVTDPLPEADLLDPTFLNETRRSQAAAVSFGASQTLSATQSISMNLSSSANWSNGDGNDYRSSAAQISYSQQVAPRVALALQLGGTISDYVDTSAGDGIMGSAMASMSWQLSETGSLQIGAGVSENRVMTEMGDEFSDTSLLATIVFCTELFRGSMCLNGNRQARPTAISGASTVTSASFGWNRSIGENSSIGLGVSYSQTEAAVSTFDNIRAGKYQTARASARLAHRIGRNLNLHLSTSALKPIDDPYNRGTNYQATFGLGYVIGR